MNFKRINSNVRGFIFLVVFSISLLTQSTAWSWSERGHHTICEVATRLVKDVNLAGFLRSRLHLMGHVCNVPDFYWRDLGVLAKSGDDTHFMNPENVGYSLDTIPADLNQIILEKEGKYSEFLKRNIVVLKDLGSAWWRYDQFYRRAVLDGKIAKSFESGAATAPPVGQPSPDKDKYHSAILGMMTNMGLMGHFIGDASQPFHNTYDYDGWIALHGGIHAYYEDRLVSELSLALPETVYQEALKLRSGKDSLPITASPFNTIRFVAIKAFPELSRILQLDPVLQPSQIIINPDGSKSRYPAKRKLPSEVASDFEPIIVKQLALSAVGLAQTWDQIYADSGKPNLSIYASYKYPLLPEFIAPDYGPAAKVKPIPLR